MSAAEIEPACSCDRQDWFATTHWSVVLTAADSTAPGAEAALNKLCGVYWYPLYAYVRRQGHNPEEAQDLTQEFFRRLLQKNYLRLAERERGRFRSFLLTALKHFLVDEWRKSQTAKRGGGQCLSFWDGEKAEALYQCEPASELTPEKVYERRWAELLLERVLENLRREFERAEKTAAFDEMKRFLWGDQISYADLAGRLDVSEGAARVAMHRFRQRYHALIRAEIAQTVAHPGEVEDEIRYLFHALA